MSSLQAVTECLSEPEVAQSQHIGLLMELVWCVKACILVAGQSCSQHSLRLFSVLLMVSSSKLIGQLQPQVHRVFVYNMRTRIHMCCTRTHTHTRTHTRTHTHTHTHTHTRTHTYTACIYVCCMHAHTQLACMGCTYIYLFW